MYTSLQLDSIVVVGRRDDPIDKIPFVVERLKPVKIFDLPELKPPQMRLPNTVTSMYKNHKWEEVVPSSGALKPIRYYLS